jgi:hypothetical protein
VNIHMLPTALITFVLLSGCAVVPPVDNVPRPMTVADTSWRVDKGFNLAEAITLIEICTSLDYGPAYSAPGIAQPQNVANWQEIFPKPEKISPDNGPPRSIGFYHNAWRLYRQIIPATDTLPIYVIGIRGTIDDKDSILDNIIATSISATNVRIQARPDRVLSFKLAETPRAEVHLGWTYGMTELMFDPTYGILKVLHDQVPRGSRLLINRSQSRRCDRNPRTCLPPLCNHGRSHE